MMSRRWMPLMVLLLAACTGPAAERPHYAMSQMAFEEVQQSSLSSASVCAGTVSKPRFIITFQGLVDFASENPAASHPASQDDLSVVLVDARYDPVKQGVDLPVLGSGSIQVHKPMLIFPSVLNSKLGKSHSPGFSWIDLTDHDIGIDASSSEEVILHRETVNTKISKVPSATNDCSLNWSVLVDELTSEPLRSAVFTSSPPGLVTSRFSIGRGEAFTSAVWTKTKAPSEPCLVRFAGTTFDRAIARTIAVAVPVSAADRKLTLEVTLPSGQSASWPFVLPDGRNGMEEAVILVANHAMNKTGKYDFAGHLALRQNLDGAIAKVPIPVFHDCYSSTPPTGNPQCSPAGNDWP